MNSLELTKHAERARRGRTAGDWHGILDRFGELAPHIDADLSIRLLRCLAGAKLDSKLLPSIVRSLPLEQGSRSHLSCWSAALLELRDALGHEELSEAFRRVEQGVLRFDEEAWGLSAPMMLVSLVRANQGWSSSCSVLVKAVACHASRMGPMHLEVSAFSCSRLLRAPEHDGASLQRAARALLAPGTRRYGRFVPRGLLNFFVALERLLGPREVVPLARAVVQRLEQSEVLGELGGCSAGDKYRAAVCLLRSTRGRGATEAIRKLLDEPCVQSLSKHAAGALLKRLDVLELGMQDLREALTQVAQGA